jgi:hypothetical protein
MCATIRPVVLFVTLLVMIMAPLHLAAQEPNCLPDTQENFSYTGSL